MIVPDAAVDTTTTPAAPPAANATSDTAPVAPPDVAATTSPSPTGGTPPAMPVTSPQTTHPTPPKATFGGSFMRGMQGPQYTTDAQGNVISSAPAEMRTKGGILGSILSGALEGAVRGVGATTPEGGRGKGAAFSAGAAAATKGAKEADDRARAIAQRNFENQQAATAEKVRINHELAETAHITQNMNFEKEEHPDIIRSRQLQNESAEIGIRGGQQRLLQDSVSFQDEMAKLGINGTLFTEHSPELTAQIPAAVSGSVRAIQNGKQGSENGVVVYPKAQLDQPLTVPVTYMSYDGSVDKDGVPIPTPHLIQPDGKLTANDYLNKYFAGRTQLYQMQQKIQADMTMETHKAALAEQAAKTGEEKAKAASDWATAHLTNVQAKNLEQSGIQLPQTYKPDPNVFTMSGPQLRQNLQQQGVQVPSDFDNLYAIGHYKGDDGIYPTRVSPKTGQKDRATAMAQVRALINPNIDEKTYPAVKKQVQEFADTRPNTAGGNIIAFNTATQHLHQLMVAKAALNTDGQVTNIPAWNSVLQFYGLQTGASPTVVFNAIKGALTGEIGKTFKGGPADIPEREDIDKNVAASQSMQQTGDWARAEAALMQSKSNQLVNQYYSWTGDLPPNAISQDTVKAYQGLGLDPYHGLPQGAQVAQGMTNNPNPNQPPPQTPPGASVLLHNGNPIGTQTAEQKTRGTYTPYPK